MTQPRIRWSLPNLKLVRAAATSSSFVGFVAPALRELFEVAFKFPGIYQARAASIPYRSSSSSGRRLGGPTACQ